MEEGQGRSDGSHSLEAHLHGDSSHCEDGADPHRPLRIGNAMRGQHSHYGFNVRWDFEEPGLAWSLGIQSHERAGSSAWRPAQCKHSRVQLGHRASDKLSSRAGADPLSRTSPAEPSGTSFTKIELIERAHCHASWRELELTSSASQCPVYKSLCQNLTQTCPLADTV